ncbi:hypothetical protein DKX38_017952 [Salix brachista]|uniref:Uncharacterized protein n=1 Tax=Salix brachista TaxID=2182728 RepID=A0A5N5KXU9_9ROSI|nr:hypothetical protein DKX38_017952 [Salix brachista]
MSHMNYTKVGKRSLRRHGASSTRGFRLKYPRRFSVQRLRARFFYLFRVFRRWRSSYGRAVQYLKRGMGRNSSIIDRCGSSERGFMMDSTRCHYMGKLDDQCRFRSFGRSNSFYSEAIADCLEFIKRFRSFGRSNSFFSEAIAECLDQFIKRSSISVEQKQVSPR